MQMQAISIKHKLTLMLMGVSLLSVVLTVLAITSYLIYDIGLSKSQELDVTATVAADRNSAALSFLDAERARANLELFRLSPSILAACIYDISGGLFSSYVAESAGGACPEKVAKVRADAASWPVNVLTSFQAIRNGETMLGTIYLVSDTHEVDAYVRKIVLISTSAALLVLAGILLMAVYIQRVVTRPLLALADVARQVTQRRDFSLQAKVFKSDEIGQLAEAFNGMLGEVRQRDQELRYANETLEHKVLLRTRELEEAKRHAEQASEAKSEFLRNISHEFRTPLHAMISFSSYGIKESETATREDQKRYFQIIQKSSERLTRLVNEVLDVAKFEHSEQVLSMSQADLVELVNRSVESVRPLLQEKAMTVSCEHEKPRADLVCDQDRIIQVMTNLMGNAIKFSPAGSHITIRTANGYIGGKPGFIVSCSDQGVGIPDYEKQAIFEPFRQSSKTKTGAGGTGLGLAICHGIVRGHGGDIWADNNESGIGAVVTFSVPCGMSEGRRRLKSNSTEVTHENAA